MTYLIRLKIIYNKTMAKITERIPTEMYAYFEIEYDSITEFKKERDNILKELPLPQPEKVPNCSICKKPMKKSKAGKYYCKHGEDWGEEVFPK